MALANKITLLRIVLIPVFVVFLYLDMQYGFLIAALIFLFCTLTDILDGYIARKQNTVSVFGKVFDPIADKVLVFAALIPLVELGLVASWIVIVLLSREFIISGFRIVHAQYGENVISASWLGKVKTFFQDAFIIMILCEPYLKFLSRFYITETFIALALIFTLWSMFDYLIRNMKTIHLTGNKNES